MRSPGKKIGEEKDPGLIEPFFKDCHSGEMMRRVTVTAGCCRIR